MASPFSNLASRVSAGAQQKVRETVMWALGPYSPWPYSKTDPVFKQHPLPVLRRAALKCDFEKLFIYPDAQPFLRADTTIEDITTRLADTIFPEGMSLAVPDDEAATETLKGVLKGIAGDNSPLYRIRAVVPEAAVMGWCAVRSVYVPELARWLWEVYPQERVKLETYPGVPDAHTAVSLFWAYTDAEDVIWWQKERWTPETWQQWEPLRASAGGECPAFKKPPAVTAPNTYGEIPVTVVPHIPDAECYGVGFVGGAEIANFKALLQRHHKRHYGDLFAANPIKVCKNHTNPGEQFRYEAGVTLHLEQGSADAPVSLETLVQPRMDSAYDETTEDLRAELWQAAGLVKPARAEKLKLGGGPSGVALEALTKPEQKKINSLRSGGYAAVFRHLAKILRMGSALGLPGWPAVPADVAVVPAYPPFLDPTDEERVTAVAAMDTAKLPPALMAQKIAALYDIEDQAIIGEIEAAWADAREAMLPGMLPPDTPPPGGAAAGG